MRIAVDGSVFVNQLTGIGKYSYHLLKELASELIDVEFVILTNRPLCIQFDAKNIQVELVSSLGASNDYLWKLFGVGMAAKRQGAELFWACNGVAPMVDLPVLLPVYDFVYRIERETMSFKSRWFRSLSQPFWIRRAKAVFTISQTVAGELRQYFGREADAVVLPAVDDSFRRTDEAETARTKARYDLPEDYLLAVGTLEPRKNLRVFIEEFLSLRAEQHSTAFPVLVLVGGKGWKDSGLVRAVAQAEEQGAVRRLGYVPDGDLPALYSGARMFFMPSRYEGFGMPILEARTCGCPVVCSDVPAMREAGGNMALYHAPDRAGIRMALQKVLQEGQAPATDCGRGVEWSWKTGAAQMKAVIEGLRP